VSRRLGLHAPKRDSGTVRRLRNFGIGGQLVGVGARVSLARDPGCHMRLARALLSHDYEIDQD
jgi:hypothetical protein